MVAVSNFSGLAISIWALASAPAIAPMVSLDVEPQQVVLGQAESADWCF
jgi:hypothetical protein